MANICCNNITFYGDVIGLKAFEKAVKTVGDDGGKITPEEICRYLKIEIPPSCGNSYDDAMGYARDMNFDTINEGYVRFTCESAWGDINEMWDVMSEHFGLNFACFSDVDGEYWVVNDPDKKWYTAEIVFDSYGDGPFAESIEFEMYDNRDELVAALNEASGENKDYSEWFFAMMEDDELGALKEIERFDYERPEYEVEL